MHKGDLGLGWLLHPRRRNIEGKRESKLSLSFILNPVLGFGIIGLPRKQLWRERHVIAKFVTFWCQLFVPIPTHPSANLLVYFFLYSFLWNAFLCLLTRGWRILQEERQAADGFARPARFCTTFHYYTFYLLKYSTVWAHQVLHYYFPVPQNLHYKVWHSMGLPCFARPACLSSFSSLLMSSSYHLYLVWPFFHQYTGLHKCTSRFCKSSFFSSSCRPGFAQPTCRCSFPPSPHHCSCRFSSLWCCHRLCSSF